MSETLIKVLGGGCPKCNKLFKMAEKAVRELGLDARVVHVHDPVEIARMTMMTPALAVGDTVVIQGLKPYDKVKQAIQQHMRA